MVSEMFTDKGRDKVVAVVVSFLHPQGEWKVPRCTGRFQIPWVQLVGKKLVIAALIDQQRNRRRTHLYQFGGIVGTP